SSDGTSGTPGLEPVPSPVPKPLCWEISVGSTRVVALKGCFPLAEAVSRRADSAMVVGIGVGGVVEEAESTFFFLALAFGLESPKQLSLRQYETVNSRAFACKTLVDHRGK
nr:hypothetical protein [Tanacetum cinerariifolium]